MRVLHVVKKYPDLIGGDGIVVQTLQRCQQADGHVVTVLTSRSASVLRRDDVVQVGLSTTSAELDATGPRRLLSLLLLAASMPLRLLRLRPDVVHCHAIDMGVAITPAARLLRLPVVHTCHDIASENPHVPAWKQRVERLMFRVAAFDRVFALTAADKGRLERAGIRRVVVVPNGVR